MKVKELGHIVLYVGDLARSRRFYGETLGWREITPEEGVGFPAAAFSSGRTHHELRPGQGDTARVRLLRRTAVAGGVVAKSAVDLIAEQEHVPLRRQPGKIAQ